jgi:ABC-type multidrug transport system ATPase subunit
VELKSIWKVFTGVPVLKGIDLNLMPGEIHALLGGNGSGKSTTMKILSGVYTPERGQISLNGESKIFHRPRDAHKSGIYMVPQEPHMFPHLSVEENLLYVSPDKALAEQLMETTDLISLRKRKPQDLSGGEQQRVGVARALAKNPVVILADEPTGNLDDYSSNVIWDLMENACQQLETTVLVVTHKIPTIFSLPYRHFIIESKGVYEVH